uniref:Putative secreted protein n=1 Tax=Anopheles marajoara TaxID=58244 RepID=A0A2M4CDJ1_9DIPT
MRGVGCFKGCSIRGKRLALLICLAREIAAGRWFEGSANSGENGLRVIKIGWLHFSEGRFQVTWRRRDICGAIE